MDQPIEHDQKKVEALYNLCCDDRTHSAVKAQNLEDTSLEYLDLFVATALYSSTMTSKVEALISAMGEYSNPREMLLAIGEQVEKAEGEVNECFGDEMDEDEEDDGEDFGMDEGDIRGKSWDDQLAARKKVDWVGERLRLAILSYAAIFTRIKTKKPESTLSDILTPLEDAISTISQAGMAGQRLSSITARKVLQSLCAMTEAGNKWLGVQVCDQAEMRSSLFGVLCKFLVLFEPQLGCNLLERWYIGHFKATLPSRRYEIEQPMQHEWTLNREAMAMVYNTFLQVGFTPVDLVATLSTPTTLTNPFLPSATLLIISTCLVPPVPTNLSILDDILTNPPQSLSELMPILGSALNGIAIDAGMCLVWELVWRLGQLGKGCLEYENATMLIELIMPNMVKEASDVSRFASHKLLGRIIRSCENGMDKVLLFDQLLSNENPFEQVRISAMALLKEELSLVISQPPGPQSIFCPELNDILLPKIFSLPDASPAILQMDLEHLLEEGTIWCEWTVEGLNLFYFLLSRGGERINLRSQLVAKKNLWWGPLRTRLSGWEVEAQALSNDPTHDHEAFDLNLRIFALREAVDRVEDVSRTMTS